ncbi:MAG: 4'-phosphopantetheinyl transferase family protein [Anaerolineae bacterium]
MRLLNEDERARALRYRFREPRQRFVVARAALRQILGQYLGTRGACITFAYGPHGKPVLSSPDARWLSFSLAHSGDVVLYAIANGVSVGVDLERLRPVDLGTGGMRCFFSIAERAWLASRSEKERAAALLLLWTCKEAWGKAIGTGLSVSPGLLDRRLATQGIPFPDPPCAWTYEDGVAGSHHFWLFEPQPRYIAAVAAIRVLDIDTEPVIASAFTAMPDRILRV